MVRYYTTREVAKILNRKVRTVRWWVSTGRIESIKAPSNQRLIPESEVERMAKECEK